MSCRAASMRAASPFAESAATASRSLASCATYPSSPFTPQREASPSIWPRESVASFGSSAAIAFSASASSSGALSLGQPFARPGDDGLADLRVGLGKLPEDLAERAVPRAPRRNARTRARRRRGPRGSGPCPTCGSRRSGGSPRRPWPRPRRRRRRASGRCRPPRRRRPRRRRPSAIRPASGIRQREQRGEPDELLAGPSSSSYFRTSGAATFGGNARAAFRRTDGRRMRERRLLHAGERRLDAIEHAEAARRPQGMDHGRREAEGVARRVLLDERQEVVLDVRLAALDQQPLGVQPPEHVVALERRDQPLRVVRRRASAGRSASRPWRRSGRCGRASCRAGASRTRRPCRSCSPRASGCAGR